MNKQIKTTPVGNFGVKEYKANIIELGGIKFIKEDVTPWIDVFLGDNSDHGYAFMDQIDTQEAKSIITLEELKIFAMNWYFNNVEIVSEDKIKKEIPSITVDYGVLESSHFYITTDDKKYKELIEKGAIPVFTPELITKEHPELESDLNLFVARVPSDK